MADSTINELVNLTSVANNDELVLWDISASETKKATVSNVVTPVATSTATSVATSTVGTTSGIMATGTCSTAAGTAQKAVTSAKWTNKPGESIMVEFTYENTADNVTLKIGTNSAIPVYYLNCASEQISGNAIPAGAVVFTLNAGGTKFYAHLTKTLSAVDTTSKLPVNSGSILNEISKSVVIDNITDCNNMIPEQNAPITTYLVYSNTANKPVGNRGFTLYASNLFGTGTMRYVTQLALLRWNDNSVEATAYVRFGYYDLGEEPSWSAWKAL